MISEQQARQSIPRVLKALAQKYGEPPEPPEGDALDLCVRTILHHESSEKAVAAAMRRFERDFVDWNEVRVSTPHQVGLAIDAAGKGEDKARALLALLQGIFQARNEMSLEFLREAGSGEARETLEGIPELGPILASKLLLLVFGHACIVVTPEVTRVAVRLDWAREDYDAVQTQRRLERLVPKASMALLHHAFREHAHRLCQAQTPKCKKCPVLRHCPFGRASAKSKSPTRKSKTRKKSKKKASGRSR